MRLLLCLLSTFACSKTPPSTTLERPSETAVGPTPSDRATEVQPPVSGIPAQDRGFVDQRQGWGWSDRCWKNLHAGNLATAKTECTKGLEIAPATGGPRPSLLYNLGLIAEKAGDMPGARKYFEQSLALRPHAEVRAALIRVGGSPPANAQNNSVKRSIPCGNVKCDNVCCATSGECAVDPSRCGRATNGEGTIYECDGPEDCESGQICCLVTMDRTVASNCTPKSSCTGSFHHPRYEEDFPDRVLCHSNADCVNGGSCKSSDYDLSRCE